MCVCVCVRACVYVCLCVCLWCVCVCVCGLFQQKNLFISFRATCALSTIRLSYFFEIFEYHTCCMWVCVRESAGLKGVCLCNESLVRTEIWSRETTQTGVCMFVFVCMCMWWCHEVFISIRMYDIWCMMYDVWCMMYDVWCMMYDVWCMMYEGIEVKQTMHNPF